MAALAALCLREQPGAAIGEFRAIVLDTLIDELAVPCAIFFPPVEELGWAIQPIAERGWPRPDPSEGMWLVEMLRAHGSPLVFAAHGLPLPGFLSAMGIASGLLVACGPDAREGGLVGVFTRQPGAFESEAIAFVVGVASALAAAERRARREIALDEAENRFLDAFRELAALGPDFVTLAAHELRTPLAVLRGYAGILAADFFELTDQERRDYFARICESSDHLTGLLEKLIGSAKAWERRRTGGRGA
jgi:signal transduction histidine kinase